MDWQNIAFSVVALLIGVVFHEYAHARVAVWRGDLTPKRAGRVTLNPIPHIDPFGTVLLPLMLILLSWGGANVFIFGYAKPVPINPFFLKRPNDIRLVSVAGVAMNFLVAGVAFGLSVLLKPSLIGTSYQDLLMLFYYIVVINIILGIFNLIPIPPLDGSHLLESFLPYEARVKFEQIGRYGFILAFVVIILLFRVLRGPMNTLFAHIYSSMVL